MAGRSVLIKSVLSSLPFYQMQSLLIPKGVLKIIEKLSRDFFWKQGDQEHKMHLISWDKIKREKDSGGLGFKDLSCQNEAFIMKLCWTLLTNQDSLWVRCIREKYRCGEGKYPKVVRKNNQSAVWRAIVTVWDSFRKAVGSKIRNGRDTNAWWELWCNLEHPLFHYVDKNHPLINHESRVAEFVNINGEWDISKWSLFLPDWAVNQILRMPPPDTHLPNDDSLFWRASSDGIFSIKTAYKLLRNGRNHDPDPPWMSIWRWPIPERAKYFMWQVFHESLPTNSLRENRGLCESNECPFHCHSEETILHILRDCEIANSLWLSIVNPLYHSTFFSGNLQVWLKWNSCHNGGSGYFHRWPWQRIFGLMCWIIWKNRCRQIFEGRSGSHPSLLHQCKYLLLEEVEGGKLKHKVFNIPSRVQERWHPPPEDYIRIDVDGSVKANWRAASGGIIRDHMGYWQGGFVQNLGSCSSTMAEILAIYAGLRVCKHKGFTKIRLYSDSTEAIHTLMVQGGTNHPLQYEIDQARSLIFSNWDLQIIHAHREAMKCADFLANMAHHTNTELTLMTQPPSLCSDLMLADLS